MVRGPTSAPGSGTFVMGRGIPFCIYTQQCWERGFFPSLLVSTVQVHRSMFVEGIGVLLGGGAECPAVLALFLEEVEQNESELACCLGRCACCLPAALDAVRLTS